MPYQVSTWVDIGGRERLTLLASHDGAADTADVLATLSNATVTTTNGGNLTAVDNPVPSTNASPDLDDCWIVTMQTPISGRKRQLYIPSPIQALTLGDNVAYDAFTDQWVAVEATIPALNHPVDGELFDTIVDAEIVRDALSNYQTWLHYRFEDYSWGRRTLFWHSAHGVPRLTHLVGNVASLGTDFDNLMNALQMVSNASITHYIENEMTVTYNEPATDQYNSVRDTADFTFVDELGNESHVFLPAPKRSLFYPDGKTINLADTYVAGFVHQAIVDLSVPSSGLPVVACVGGHLSHQPVY